MTEKSILEQMSECERLGVRDNLQVIIKWEESRSAKTPRKRPYYSEMIRMIEGGQLDAIVCWHINRLVRNMEEGGYLAQLLIDGKIQEIRTPSAIYRTGDNIMPLVIEAASATQFSLDHSRNVSRGMDGSFRAGDCTHAAPQGYRNVRNPLNLKKGGIECDPERFDTIRRAWDLMLSGTCSKRQVLTALNVVWGYRARPSKKRGDRPLSYTGLSRIFANPFYAGYVRRKGEIVRGNHTPMISPDEFSRVQQILNKASYAVPRKREWAFTGLMRCLHCGHSITAEAKRLRDGRLWECYRCSDPKLQCTKKGLSADKVRAKISEELDALQIDPDLLAIARENLLMFLESESSAVEKTTTDQKNALVQLESRLQRLDDMWLEGILTDRSRYIAIQTHELAKKQAITFALDHARAELSRMQQNANRVCTFLARARDELRVAEPQRAKTIAKALATTYVFDGVAKTIEIVLNPILVGMVHYARGFDKIEPDGAGSQSQIDASFEKTHLFGGRERHLIEPEPQLLEALKSDLFIDPWRLGESGEPVLGITDMVDSEAHLS